VGLIVFLSELAKSETCQNCPWNGLIAGNQFVIFATVAAVAGSLVVLVFFCFFFVFCVGVFFSSGSAFVLLTT